jgi:DNA end-binding protein Ku
MAKKQKTAASKEHHRAARGKAAGARPFWSGTISFGLVSVPVNLFPAGRGSRAGLRMLDESGTPLVRRYFCPAHGKMVHPEHIVRGYEVDEGEYVVVSDEELQSLQPQKSREIDLVQFVDLQEIPPLLIERTYILTPAGESNKAYRLLAEVLQDTERAGIATFVMRDREYLVAITAADGILRAHTLRFEDEVRRPEDLGFSTPAKVPKRATAEFTVEIKKLTSDELNASKLRDDRAQRLLKLVKAKQSRGEDVVEVESEVADSEDEVVDQAEEVDLLETIRRNLAAAKDRTGEASRSSNGHRQVALEDQPKDDLYDRAAALEISGRSRMSKSELIRAIRRRDAR